MSEEKKSGDQQPNIEMIKYVVGDNLHNNDNELFYELLLLGESESNINVLYININKLVLAPGMNVFFYSETIENKTILDIESFNEDTCFRLIEKHKKCLYKTDEFQILFVDEVKKLNNLHSGVVMQKMDLTFDLKGLFLDRLDDPDTYEIRLDNKIIIESIRRNFKKIYVSSNDLLNGFNIKCLKINPFSLFNCDHSTEFEKPILYSYYYEKKDILSNDDLWLLKKSNISKIITNSSLNIIGPIIILTLLYNIFTTSSIYTFIWISFIILGVISAIAYMSIDSKVDKIKKIVVQKKDDLIEIINISNIKGTFIAILVIIISLFLFSREYKYNADFVYDNESKIFLDDKSFNVSNDLIFEKEKIINRFIPVYKDHMIDIIYQTPDNLLSFSNKYIDIEINFTFKKGEYLLGDNIKNALFDIRNNMQMRVSSGYYGNISKMSTYDYRKLLITIEEDLMNFVSIAINQDKSVIEEIKIITKYAKLHNVDK